MRRWVDISLGFHNFQAIVVQGYHSRTDWVLNLIADKILNDTKALDCWLGTSTILEVLMISFLQKFILVAS